MFTMAVYDIIQTNWYIGYNVQKPETNYVKTLQEVAMAMKDY
jgi:hypothetical protein